MSTERRPERPDASMSLLFDAADNPIDPAYQEAVRKRADRTGDSAPGRWVRFGVGALAAVLGLGTVWAARELAAPQPEALRARSLLQEEIHRRGEVARALAAETAALSAEVDALSRAQLEGGDERIQELLGQGALAGTAPVEGPGLVIRLTDSPRAAGGDPDAIDERVQDIDLQILSNGLWSSGAEAISINGHRLTAVSAVRSAGEAVLVDLTPLVSPFVVEAIGDPEEMQVALARTAAARHLQLLRDTYDIGAEVSTAERLSLPGGAVPDLRYAVPTVESGLAPESGAAEIEKSERNEGGTE